MYRISSIFAWIIPLIVDYRAVAILNPTTIIYSSKASTDLVTLLYLVLLQWIILALILIVDLSSCCSLVRVITYLIWELRSTLLANAVSTNISNFNFSGASLINCRPQR